MLNRTTNWTLSASANRLNQATRSHDQVTLAHALLVGFNARLRGPVGVRMCDIMSDPINNGSKCRLDTIPGVSAVADWPVERVTTHLAHQAQTQRWGGDPSRRSGVPSGRGVYPSQ